MSTKENDIIVVESDEQMPKLTFKVKNPWADWEIWEDNTKQKRKMKRINPLFTYEMKNELMTKEIYYTKKSDEEIDLTFRNIKELRSDWPESWSYHHFRWLMWNYPEYIFWTTLTKPDNEYLGSSEGPNIYSYKTKKLLSKGNLDSLEKNDEYIRINLNNKKKGLHILLMKMVIPEKFHSQIKMVNHIGSKRRINELSNLEPSNGKHNRECSHKEGNASHICVGIRRTSKSDENDIVEYKSMKDAANDEQNDITYYNIQKKFQDEIYFFRGEYKYERMTEKKQREKLPPMSQEEFEKRFKEIIEVIIIDIKKNIVTYNYTGYYIANDDGTVCTIENGERYIVQPYLVSGYWLINLSNNGISNGFQVHRLVLIVHGKVNSETGMHLHGYTGEDIEYWYFQSDHIDKDNKHNNLKNLRWLTPAENSNREKKCKPIMIYNSKKEFVHVFESVKMFQNILKSKISSNIEKACRAEFNSTYLGHYFSYISDETYEEYKTLNKTFSLGPLKGINDDYGKTLRISSSDEIEIF